MVLELNSQRICSSTSFFFKNTVSRIDSKVLNCTVSLLIEALFLVNRSDESKAITTSIKYI